VNSAQTEGKEEDTNGEDKEKDKEAEPETEAEVQRTEEEPVAESSKAAGERAAKAKEQVRASSSSSSGASSTPSETPPSSSAPSSPSSPNKTGREIAKPSIPEVYPQVLALPITRRPLFPGFYKAVTITSPAVIKAIRELLAHGQPYIGAFLLKDSSSDSDVITSLDQVHPVGVFAQITSVFGSTESAAKEEGGEPKPETLTAVLYPHRRIRIDELVKDAPEFVPIAQVVEEVQKQETDTEAEAESESEVASFEEEVPSVEEVREELGTVSSEKESTPTEKTESEQTSETSEQKPPLSQVNFLHSLLPDISLTNVSNLNVESYKKDSQMIRAIMSELISVFKDIAQLQPIFREQSEKPFPMRQCSALTSTPHFSHVVHHVQLHFQRV
jgi:Lon-like ATP-dependent protease